MGELDEFRRVFGRLRLVIPSSSETGFEVGVRNGRGKKDRVNSRRCLYPFPSKDISSRQHHKVL